MTPVKLQIEQWAAWAPGLDSREAWLRWLAAPWPLPTHGAPALSEMPAMMRRRTEPLGRAALQPAYQAQGAQPTGPVVFASRWGELARSVDMLQQLAAGEPLSPTAFSLSVHNAVGALYSIARGDRHSYQAVSAGDCSVEAGFIEAVGLLSDGASRVLLVYFDQALPQVYAEFDDAAAPLSFPHAFACLLAPAALGGIALNSGQADADRDPSDGLAPGLQVLRFLLGRGPELRRAGPVGCWRWVRDDGV